MWGHEGRAPVAVGGGVACSEKGWMSRLCGGGGYSQDSEPDLAALVSDFLEIGSAGAESWCSSDSDSGYSDLAFLADKISLCKKSEDQYQSDLMLVVHSLILSLTEKSYLGKPDTCNGNCIRFSLVKLLQSSGYDAALCATKWQGFGKIPGGEHEFIEVTNHQNVGCTERYIIDIDFRSHFEIARAVKSYDTVLMSLPPVFVGSVTKLKEFLQIMVEAAKCSLKLNSMPLPPWRSLAYLEAKWESPCHRVTSFPADSMTSTCSSYHQRCIGLLRRIKSGVDSEIKPEKLLIPGKNKRWRPKADRWRHSSERTQ